MTTVAPDCFVCGPAIPPIAESLWAWSAARTPCRAHAMQTALVTAGDEPFFAALRRFDAQERVLDGGVEGVIFNPLHLIEPDGRRHRVWAAYGGGGVFPCEDRFGARTWFENRACESVEAVDLLYAFRRIVDTMEKSTTKESAWSMIFSAIGSVTLPTGMNPQTRGPAAGVSTLTSAWNLQRDLDAIRLDAGREWPQSREELRAWAARCNRTEMTLRPGTEVDFAVTLYALARRRFPELPQ